MDLGEPDAETLTALQPWGSGVASGGAEGPWKIRLPSSERAGHSDSLCEPHCAQ
jgi:hypothetical protein